MKQLNVPMRRWVPDRLGLIAIFIIILPVTMLNGSYTGSMPEMSSTLGTNTEDITMGYYAAAAGMAVAYPIVAKVLAAIPVKVVLIVDLALQFLLSWCCASTTDVDILIVCSFIIGFLKEFIMLWFIRCSKLIFSPSNVRSEFYAYFYPIVYAGGQFSMYATALLAYQYNWKYMYYFMMVLLLISLLLVIVCFRSNRPIQSVATTDLHIREMCVIAAGLLMLMYVINYGKVLDWTSSDKIRLYIVLSPILIALFIWTQHYSRKPYVSLAPLFQPKTLIGYLFMMIAMFFSTSTTLISSYLNTCLRVDNMHTYSLYIYVIPGYIVSAIVCFWWFRWQRWRFRFLVSGSLFCFVLFFGILYFGISPDSTYEMLYLPVFLRGAGMMTLLIAFALFATEDLNPKFLTANAFFMIAFRSALAPIAASAFYSNTLYRLQQHNMYALSEQMASIDPTAATRYSQAFGSALAQGHSYTEAVQIATGTLNTILQQQSTLLALKEILGYLLIFSLVIAIVSRFIPFHKTVRVVFAKTGDDMV
jgi:hypothetical protein